MLLIPPLGGLKGRGNSPCDFFSNKKSEPWPMVLAKLPGGPGISSDWVQLGVIMEQHSLDC